MHYINNCYCANLYLSMNLCEKMSSPCNQGGRGGNMVLLPPLKNPRYTTVYIYIYGEFHEKRDIKIEF